MGGVIQVERRVRELYDPPARWSSTRSREQFGVARGIRKPDGSGSSSRPIVQPPQAMGNLRRADSLREFEYWEPSGRNPRLVHRVNRLPSDLRRRFGRRRMPPVRAGALRHAFKHTRRHRGHGLIQRQLCMDIEHRLTARRLTPRCLQSMNHHGVALVTVAHERESPVPHLLSEPCVARRQGDGVPVFGDLPLQTQAEQSPFHALDDREHAAVTVRERWRVDGDAEPSSSCHRLHPVTTMLRVASSSTSASLWASVLTPTTKPYPHSVAMLRSSRIVATCCRTTCP